jgi:ribonuclease J
MPPTSPPATVGPATRQAPTVPWSVPAHASGHIYVADLVELVQALNAKAVIPIHTSEPQLFRDHFPNTVLLADGESYPIPG